MKNVPALISSVFFIVSQVLVLLFGKGRITKLMASFLSILITALIFITWSWLDVRELLKAEKTTSQQAKDEVSACTKLKNPTTPEANTLGYSSNPDKTAADFARQWDWSSFKRINEDTFCPLKKGGNNYQRMIYKYPTSLAGSTLVLKFQVINENETEKIYVQRVVVGIRGNAGYLSEFDFPTREESVVNFRVASESGGLVSGKSGETLGSAIKDGSTINLEFKTQKKLLQEVTGLIGIDSISTIEQYGSIKKDFSLDFKVNDTNPESAKAFLYLGSYVGGCVKIQGWNAY